MFGRLKVAIMGTGKIAGIMAGTLQETKGVVCYAVGSRTMAKAETFAKEHGIKKYYGSYEELVADSKVDLVYVATPHSEHYENVKMALNAGKHVICEKAFMLNENQAKEIFSLAEEKKLLVTEAMWIRYMPFIAKIKEVLASNVIGEPAMLTANLGYNVAYKDRITQPSLGGGALLDLGVYPLNIASMIFGNDVSDIASICTFNDLGMDMQDSITLRYTNGKMAVLNVTALSITDRRCTVYGSKGFMIIDNINNPEGITVYDSEYKKLAYYKRPNQITGYEYEIMACDRAISEKWLECPEMPHSETLKILNMMDFIRKSNNIVFPGEKEGVADTEAPLLPDKESKPEVEEQTEAAEVISTEGASNADDSTDGASVESIE
ncbi:MAG: Gfo/Idh/MocA family oxidoreductase [Butyrivibrio sp.]|nr:Gfo/Idh/MocA family oxidoreductase [Butyrivibrio sp.]